MLTPLQFDVLRTLDRNQATTQREVAQLVGISLGSANKAIRELQQRGLLSEELTVTDEGLLSLAPYRVRNAVILAAGIGRRLAPLSFERPKALFKVRGEVLIERLIGQLHEAGVNDIYIVIGSMKESFYYLEDKLGVHLIENPDYVFRNNNASLYAAREHLGNSYVCSSDQYYEENVFNTYELRSNCLASETSGSQTDAKLALELGSSDLITGAEKEDGLAWRMNGPAYLDDAFAKRYIKILSNEYNLPETEGKLWETVYIEHADELKMYVRKVDANLIHEFCSLDDLCAFDTDFMENVDSAILDNICRTLDCHRDEITDVELLNSGLTNLSVLFSCRGERYIYRHPGAGTDEIINRESETYALKVASRLGLDTSYIYEDPHAGWKISRFIPDCTDFDYSNDSQVKQALGIARKLHTSGASTPWSFDFYSEGVRLSSLLKKEGWPLPDDFDSLASRIGDLVEPMRAGAGKPVLCHNDFYGPNLLVKDGDICLIDWEYAAMGDYGCDFGNFVAQGSGYDVNRALEVLPFYFGRPATEEEKLHCMICVAVVGWYWYVWALFKACKGSPCGDWTRIWRDAAKEYGSYAQSLLKQGIVNQHELTKPEFDALVAIESGSAKNADESVLESLQSEGFVDGNSLTTSGFMALEPYRAKRAVFFAAGFGSRMLPITVNTPKPLVRVHGVRFIDRLIDAVIAADINEIYVVRGYLKEEFDQLKSKYPQIRFIDNDLYNETNNISSAVAAKDFFQNAYAFESDLYLTDPSYITKYQYQSNYLAFPVESTDDWYFDVNGEGRITKIGKGSDHPCWQMVGLSYWTAEDGRKLADDLPRAFDASEENRQIFWDEVPLREAADKYDVTVRRCDSSHIIEIDSFAELQEVDEAYRF